MKTQNRSSAELSRHLATPPSWWRYWLMDIAGLWKSVLMLVISLLLFSLSIGSIWRYALSRSASVTAPFQLGSGVVINKTIGIHHNAWESPKRNGNPPMSYSVQFRMGERLVWGVTL